LSGSTGNKGPLSDDLVRSKGTLVVCNVSLVGQWESEVKSKLRLVRRGGNGNGSTSQVRVYMHHGDKAKRLGQSVLSRQRIARCDIVLTTFDVIRAEGAAGPLLGIHWHRLVLDEAHLLANTNSVRTKLILFITGKGCFRGIC
jgi:SNF2 family DNA or RNA helicase